MIYSKLTDLIGNTPMLAVPDAPGHASIILKLEGCNPGGSAKDRVALEMILDAEARGVLKPGATIIEPTSGNTGIGLAWVGLVRGYKTILTMPDTMSVERINLLKAYGARIELTPGAGGMAAAISRAEELQREIEGSVILGQFVNPANPEAHVKTTGEEIWRDTDGKIDIFVAGVGTGGTVSGTGKALKAHNPSVRVVGYEPASSAFITTGKAGKHKIQGIGAGFIPKTYLSEYVDEVIAVSDDEAIEGSRELARTAGLLSGFSGGGAYAAAKILASRPENAGKTIVALIPDSGERYLSTELFR